MKTPAVIAIERAEAAQLAATILKLTGHIPQRIINTPGVIYAKRFKKLMVAARAAALAPTLNRTKLLRAMADVDFYYGKHNEIEGDNDNGP